jgi:hypothetical protein
MMDSKVIPYSIILLLIPTRKPAVYPGFQSLRDVSIYYLLLKALESRVPAVWSATILHFMLKTGAPLDPSNMNPESYVTTFF